MMYQLTTNHWGETPTAHLSTCRLTAAFDLDLERWRVDDLDDEVLLHGVQT